MQLSLLDQLSPVPDQNFRSLVRSKLGSNSWVEYAPAWLAGEQKVMDELIVTATWEKHQRTMFDRLVDVPRLVAGVPGTQGGGGWQDQQVDFIEAQATRSQVQSAASRLAHWSALLSVRYGRVLDSISLAYYRDGKDSVAYHGDKMGPLRGDTVIAIVSLGSPRSFLLRKAGGGKRLHSFRFGAGDLLVMGGACQQEYEHGVPKMKHAGPRLAVMFRERIPEGAKTLRLNANVRGPSDKAVA